MKWIVRFSLLMCTCILLFTIPSVAAAELSTHWKVWPTKTEVDIDKEWVIQFNDDIEMDWTSLSKGISVVRDRDNKRMRVIPNPIYEDKSKINLFLEELYEFGETYHLSIDNVQSIKGTRLKEPITMKFQTVNPEFNVEKTIERDGIKLHVMLNAEELSTDEKLYAKLKITNVSDHAIPHWGLDGCDLGLTASLFSKSDAGKVEVGRKWNNRVCTSAIEQYFIEPGETIEVFEVLSPPTNQLNEKNYLKVVFRKGLYDNYTDFSPITLMEIPIKIKELK